MRHLTVVILSLAISLSIQACPSGWRQSTIDPTKCYLVVVSKKIWFEAGAYCSSMSPGAVLTSITSAYENFGLNAIVTDTPSISACDQLWIGANDFDQNGQFVWVDNKPFQYRNWATGQPDLNNQCVSSQARTTGKWKTEPCGTENCFICDTYTSSSGGTTTSTMRTTTPTQSPPGAMTDCYDWLHYGGATSDGIYLINPAAGGGPFNVYCDMTTNGGGWTLFQKRIDNSLLFWNKTWAEYKVGFNNGLNRNHWLGLDKLHLLSTKDASVTLRIDLKGDRCSQITGFPGPCNPQSMPNGYWWGEYIFSVGDEASSYRLQTSVINAGNLTRPTNDATDGFNYHNGNKFSTVDRDNSNENCAQDGTGAWWDKDCNRCALNGKYAPGPGKYNLYCESYYDQAYDVVPYSTEMKLRKN